MKRLIVIIALVFNGITIAAQNVGIGTSSPSQKLDVAGNIKLTGAIMPNGIAGTAGQVLTSAGAGAADPVGNYLHRHQLRRGHDLYAA